jgi:DNA polymerase III subunit delta'
MSAFLPWQTDIANRWLSRVERRAHATLIHGMAGIGKRQFALGLAASLLCDSPVGVMACGQCQACRWVRQGHHPDCKRVRPDALAAREGIDVGLDATDEALVDVPEAGSSTTKKKLSEEIRVDQIRVMEPWYHRATHRGGWRVVVLYPAQAMTTIAANALLKALEEPASETLFLLVTDGPDRLLPTIVSRCQALALPMPNRQDCVNWLQTQGLAEAEQWLSAAGGAPLRALELSESHTSACPDWALTLTDKLAKGQPLEVGQLADELAKLAAHEWLTVLQRLAIDLTWLSSGLPARYFPALGKALQTASQRRTVGQWADISAWLNQQSRLQNHPLNAKLFAHACLERFMVTS